MIHPVSSLQVMPNGDIITCGHLPPNAKNTLYKTELCKHFVENGSCRYGNKCQFAHGEHELRNVLRHPKYKTTKCKVFAATGQCPYGSRCRFLHNEHLPPFMGKGMCNGMIPSFNIGPHPNSQLHPMLGTSSMPNTMSSRPGPQCFHPPHMLCNGEANTAHYGMPFQLSGEKLTHNPMCHSGCSNFYSNSNCVGHNPPGAAIDQGNMFPAVGAHVNGPATHPALSGYDYSMSLNPAFVPNKSGTKDLSFTWIESVSNSSSNPPSVGKLDSDASSPQSPQEYIETMWRSFDASVLTVVHNANIKDEAEDLSSSFTDLRISELVSPSSRHAESSSRQPISNLPPKAVHPFVGENGDDSSTEPQHPYSHTTFPTTGVLDKKLTRSNHEEPPVPSVPMTSPAHSSNPADEECLEEGGTSSCDVAFKNSRLSIFQNLCCEEGEAA